MPRICLPVPNARFARRSFSIPVALAFLLAVFAPSSRAAAQTCTASPCSGGAISTNPTSDPSKENQSAHSSIDVSLGGTVNATPGSVMVELDGLNTNTGSGLTNDSLGEASFVLSGPGGAIVLLGSTGDGSTLTGYQITVSDSATSLAPYGSAFGSSPTEVKPASYWVANYNSEPSNLPGGTVYPTTDGSATLTNVFGGFSTDGTWTLYAILSNGDNSAVSITGWKLYLSYTATANVNTTTSLSANNNHQSLGNTITFTATVTAAGGVSGGTVTFTNNATDATLCSGVPVSNGTAQCSYPASSLGEGFSTIKAAYSGTGYEPSNGTMAEMVEGTTTNPSTNRYCNAGPVTSNGGDSTGKVYPSIITVSGLSNTVANVEVELNGVTTTSGGLEGAHLLVAPGGTKNLDFLDEGFSATALSDVNVDILDSASNYPNGTQTPTNNSHWSPTDNNQFDTSFSNTTPTANSLDSAVPDVPGTVNYAYPLGSVNESFETNFNGATANGDWALYLFDNASVTETLSGGWCLDFTLNTGTPTTTTVASSNNKAGPNGAHVGDAVTLTATVKDSSNNPVSAGTVTFTENGVAPAGTVSGNNVVTLNGSGQAAFTTSTLAEGDHTINVNYSGDSTDNESQTTIVQRIDNKTVFASASGVIQACNPGAITSTDGATGAFTPNPSNLFVQNLPGTVQSVTLQLNNMYADSDETINNTEAMVAGPNNVGLDFYSGTGDAAFGPFGPFNMVFSDSAGEMVPQTSYAGGSYRATDYGNSDTFFASASGFYPLPGSIDSALSHGSATFASVFTDGMNGNGTWSLFWDVTDKALVEGTQNGWCMSFTENPVTVTPTLAYSGTGISSDFVQGEQGASITLDVTNNGTGSTGDPAGTNPLTVTDTLNSAFTYDSSVANGTDWSCSASSGTVTCTNHDTVAQDGSYPPLTIGVNVAANASATVSNSINVSGAGITANSADDSITVDPAPVLAVAKSHTDTFTQGQTATWNITVSNTAASGQTSGLITVGDTLPTGYTLQGSTSTNSNFGCGASSNVVTCTSTAAIVGGGNNVINLTVNVPLTSSTSVTNTASAYGGGDLVHTSGNPALSNADPATVVQVPATVTITSGGTQSASINTAFATQLTVLVKDAAGVAIPNQAVTFTAPPSGAGGVFSNTTNTITATTASTGTVGQLAETFTANGTPGGPYSVTATAGTVSASPAFSLTNTAGTTTTAGSTSAPFSAGNQTVPLSATVTSAGGTVNAGTVTFSVYNASNVQIGASTTPANVTSGSALASYTLPGGTGTGTYTIVASYTGAGGFVSSSDNTHTLTVQQMATQVVVSGYPSPVYVGAAHTGTVTVEDGNGVPVSTYSGSANIVTSDSGATVTTPVTITNGTGTFTVTFAATGTQSITASINGLSSVSQAGIQVNATPSFVVTTATDDATGVATNCPVGGGGNDCSLRDALAAAASAGTANITFDSTVFSAPTTITLGSGGTLTIPSSTSIQGPTTGSGATLTNLVTVDGNHTYTVFLVGSGTTGASISNLMIVNGNATELLPSSSLKAGGGAANYGILTLTGCTISQNVSPDVGGGIANYGTLNVSNSTISGNSASSGGGGGILDYGTTTVTGSTLSGNSATYGGGIFNLATVKVMNSTLSGNSVSVRGGGVYNNGGTLSLDNSILSGNSATDDSPNGFGAATGSNNLIGIGTGLSLTGSNNQIGTSGSPVDPALTALANYGGPTQTMIPAPGSPAICAGSYSAAHTAGIAADQRGVAFGDTGAGSYCATGNIDIGAVQTDYAIAFNPVSGTVGPPPTGTLPGTAMSPAPQVSVTESGAAFTASAVSIGVTDANSDLTTSPASASTSNGVATYGSLIFTNTTTGDTLTATLPLNPGLATPLNITAQSASFDVGTIGTTTAISCAACTPNPTVGTSLTFTAVVSPNSGSVTPTGSITFSVDSGAAVAGTAASCPGGSPANSVCATYTTTTLTATSHTVEAIFTATGSFQDSNNSTGVTLVAAPALAISKLHTGTFTQGSTGIWKLVVSNTAASGSTTGTVTVSDTLPSGFTLSSYTSTGSLFTCSGTTTVTCTGTPGIAGGGSNTITLTVNIPATSPTTVNNTASVWGGGDPIHTSSGTAASGTDSKVPVVQVSSTISIVSGSNQSATISSSFTSPLIVVVKDAAGNTVSGASVTFTAPGSGASGTFSNSTTTITSSTNGSGQLSEAFTANGTAGGPYNVTATSGTSTTSPAFSLTNTAGTTTTAANQSATYSASSQIVTLSATVTSAGGTVNSGTVTFTVFQGATQIGLATAPATVSNGMASANYTLPGGTGAGSYTIVASYTGASPFTSSSDNTHKLTVNGGTTTTAGANAAAVYNASHQPVTLKATVTSAAGTVNSGTVTFTVFQGATQIGLATAPATVINGAASAVYTLPGGTNAGNYTIVASYTGAGGFSSSSNNTHLLTVSAAGSTTTAANQVANFNPSSQTVVLSATVTSTAGTVNGGTVTFTVLNGATPVGTAVTSSTVSGGHASANYSLPAGTAAKTYTIKGVYNGSTDFTTSSDSNHTLTVGAVPIASISPTSISFGDVYLGKTVTKTVTIKNTGDAAMTISGPRIAIVSGGNSKEFVTVNLCPSSLAAGKSCVMTVTFIAGPFYNPQTATLMITDSAAGSPQTVSLTATVLHPVAQVNPESLRFPAEKTRSGESTESITVASVGATPLEISRVAIVGADSRDFSETNNCEAETLNPRADCSIAVTFKPETRGSETAILLVTDDAQSGPEAISISGTSY